MTPARRWALSCSGFAPAVWAWARSWSTWSGRPRFASNPTSAGSAWPSRPREKRLPEAPWRGRLAVIGIGLEGPAGLGPRARRRLAAATAVVGHHRHLALLGNDPRALEWDGRPASLDALLSGRDGERTALLASGDPNLFGLGATLI